MPVTGKSQPRETPGVTRTTKAGRTARIFAARDAERPTGSRCRPSCRRPSGTGAHCSVCHRGFPGVGYFDQHRRDGYCIDPATFGLVEAAGLWTTPEGHEARALSAARLAELKTRNAA